MWIYYKPQKHTQMKISAIKLISTFLAFTFTAAIIIYIIATMANGRFTNPSEWSEGSRIFCTIISLLGGMLLTAYHFDITQSENEL